MQTKTKAPVTVGDVIAWFDERQDKRDAFLRANGLAAATLTPVGEDCAFRRYFRLHHNDRAMILMESVPDNAEFVTPGHKLSDFIRIGTALRDTGVATPQVYAADAENGYVLLEDFGSLIEVVVSCVSQCSVDDQVGCYLRQLVLIAVR